MKVFFPFLFTFLISENIEAQNKVTELTNFDKIDLQNLDGEVTIELGKPFNVEIKSNKDANAVKTEIKNGTLKIYLTKADNNYQSINKIDIKIYMPEISKLNNSTNANVAVNNFKGRYLSINNRSNGDVLLNGSIVDELDIENNGNGNIDAKNIIAKTAAITKTGNGDVAINCTTSFKVKASGNGDVTNYGKANALIIQKTGNGDVITK
jgi:hypothetical protein